MNFNSHVASVIAAYWVVSISMVYLNKMLLSNEDASIAAPLFVTWYQCVVTSIICVVLGNMGEVSRMNGVKTFTSQFPKVEFELQSAMSVLPLSLIFVGMVSFNNLCLQYVEVSFYNVARCLSLLFNVIFTYLILGKTTSAMSCATLLVVILGFILGINGEIDFSFFGTMAGVLASLFVSLNSIYTSKVLPYVNNDKSVLLFYNNANASFLFLPLIALFETHVILENSDKLFSLFFWSCMTLTGAMGFGIGIVTVMQVQATSPLGHNISGTAKAAFQSLLAFYIWGNQATFQGVLGILMVIFGSGLYAWVQMMSSKPVNVDKSKAGTGGAGVNALTASVSAVSSAAAGGGSGSGSGDQEKV